MRNIITFCGLLFVTLLVSCAGDDRFKRVTTEDPCTLKLNNPGASANMDNYVDIYAEIAGEYYREVDVVSRRLGRDLDSLGKIQDLFDRQQQLEIVRQSWKDLSRIYSRAEMMETVGFLTTKGGNNNTYAARINTWPITDGMVSNIERLVADDSKSVVLSQILGAHYQEGQERGDKVSVGIHVLEYLLWGTSGATGGRGDKLIDAFTVAETTYMDVLLNQVLIADFENAHRAWAPDSDFRGTFVNEIGTFTQFNDNQVYSTERAFYESLNSIATTAGSVLATRLLTDAVVDKSAAPSRFSNDSNGNLIALVNSIFDVYRSEYVTQVGCKVSGAPLLSVLVNERARVSDSQRRATYDALVAEFDRTIKTIQEELNIFILNSSFGSINEVPFTETTENSVKNLKAALLRLSVIINNPDALGDDLLDLLFNDIVPEGPEDIRGV